MRYSIKVIFSFLLSVAVIFGLSACQENDTKGNGGSANAETYTCPMHPQIVSNKPGTCHICGMDLVLFDKSNKADYLTLSESQQALANITTEAVNTGSFSSTKRVNGRLVVNPEQTELISSRVAGRIEALYIKETGVAVRKGQPLYKIYSEQLASLQQEYLIAQAQFAQFPQDAKFMQMVDAAKQKLLLYGQTEAQLRDLKYNKQPSPYSIYASTVTGTISELAVSEGQYVAEGAPIVRVESYQGIWVEADLYPAESDLVKQGDFVTVLVAGFENSPQKMRIEFIAPALQTGSQVTIIRGSIANSGNQLRAGMQAIIELPVANVSNALSLPVDAVIRDENTAHIWVATGEGKFEPRKVETGTVSFDRIEIKNGLKKGDVVVISGAYLLYSEFVLKKGKNPIAES